MTMFRLLKLRRLPSYNSQLASCGITSNLMTRTCAFCNHSFVLKSPKESVLFSPCGSSRMQSTNTRTAMQNNLTKKKKRKSKKKYAELLEVTEDSSSQKKASVSKLTSKHLSLLAEQPDINLSQLYNLRKLTGSENDNPTLSSLSHEQRAVIFIPKGMDLQSVKERLMDVLQSMCSEEYQETTTFSSRENMSVIGSVTEPCTSECNHTDASKVELLSEAHLVPEFDLSIDDSVFQSKEMEDLESVPHQQLTFKEEMEEHHEHLHDLETMSAVLPDNTMPVKIRKVESSSVPLSKKSMKKKHLELLAKSASRELDQAAREESLARNLFSYLDLCVNCGLLNRGLSTLNYYRTRSKSEKNIPKPSSIRLYDILLHGFAAKANLNKVQDILRIVDEDKIKWSLQTFAASLECIGRLPQNCSHQPLLSNWMARLEALGWTPNDVIVKATYVADQRDMALKAIRLVLPDFKPEFPPPEKCYSCSLLQELNGIRESSALVWDSQNLTPKSPMEDVTKPHNLRESAKEQLEMEIKNIIHVKSIEKRKNASYSVQQYRQKLEEAQSVWQKAAMDAFRRESEVLRVQQSNVRSFKILDLYPYLHVLPAEEYIDIIMQEIRKLAEGSETFSPTTNQLYRELGHKVQARYEIHYKRKVGILNKVEQLYEEYCKWYTNPEGPADNSREQWQILVHKNHEGPDVTAGEKVWSSTVVTSLGKFLYNIILRDIKIDVNLTRHNCKAQHLLPAFYTLFRNHGRFMKEEVKPHPSLTRLFRGAELEDLVFEVSSVPMLSPPIPWVQATNAGGYMVAHTTLMRLPFQAIQQRHRLDSVPVAQLYPALDALNQLGSVPWTVNQPMLDVVIEVFNEGGSVRLDIPQPPSACSAAPVITSGMSKQERFAVFRQRMALRRRRAEMYSLWCDALYRLSLANHYRDKVFWLPHNMDFRGRVYPCPPHLNHLGSDMARALLQFAKGQSLGPGGLDWLKIHLINLTGLAKRDPVVRRLALANELLPEILDSADNPLTGNMWWAQADEPWQTLACCKDVANAVRSDNPEEYVSHFPVHQDGSCNGLQHYAALGRDQAGAQSVNLTPSACPQDVYSCVASIVEQERMKDAAGGNPIAQVLEGFVHRKVIKQTVMTTVYGVTRFGARLQIARQLKDIDSFPKEHVWQASMYLVGKTFESLRAMFTSTKEIQDWLTECARMISQVCGQNVEWVTPLGLPVVQPYNRIKNSESQSRGFHNQIAMDMFERPNVMKQKNAFPPNFIHSLDSCHMMLTSLFCERAGITFISVHDCFWTHASAIPVMNEICREQFVALHSLPILQDLSQFLVDKFSYPESEIQSKDKTLSATKIALNTTLRSLPNTGEFDLNSVLSSVYFFS